MSSVLDIDMGSREHNRTVFQNVFESCKHLGKLPKTLLGNKKCSRHERRATEREFQNWLELEADVSFRHCGCKINVLHRHTVLTVVSYLSTHWAGSGSVFVALSVVFASVKANFVFCCGETRVTSSQNVLRLMSAL